MLICGNSDDRQVYLRRIEKVKFGAPVEEAFNRDIPATLLVLLLKLNKEGVVKKDIWRAPGNQAQVRKLIHIMQHGRLVNLANFSVYTAASVIKKFLSKLPGGIFGSENERRLFDCVEIAEPERRREAICRVVQSLPVPSQHLLVLLFGTFRMISDGSVTYNTKMSPESIGISVAPSLFHTCIHDGHRAHMEDVVRFRIASQIVSFIVSNFGCTNMFPRENYEYYARITGRTLHIDENWTFSFRSEYLFHPCSHERMNDQADGEKTWMSEEPNECSLRLTVSPLRSSSRSHSIPKVSGNPHIPVLTQGHRVPSIFDTDVLLSYFESLQNLCATVDSSVGLPATPYRQCDCDVSGCVLQELSVKSLSCQF